MNWYQSFEIKKTFANPFYMLKTNHSYSTYLSKQVYRFQPLNQADAYYPEKKPPGQKKERIK